MEVIQSLNADTLVFRPVVAQSVKTENKMMDHYLLNCFKLKKITSSVTVDSKLSPNRNPSSRRCIDNYRTADISLTIIINISLVIFNESICSFCFEGNHFLTIQVYLLLAGVITQIFELVTNGEKNDGKDWQKVKRDIIVTFPCFRSVLGNPSDKAVPGAERIK
jgi:hypothetical protein